MPYGAGFRQTDTQSLLLLFVYAGVCFSVAIAVKSGDVNLMRRLGRIESERHLAGGTVGVETGNFAQTEFKIRLISQIRIVSP